MSSPSEAKPAAETRPPAAKRRRGTVDIDAPSVEEYIHAWKSTIETDADLQICGSLFGSNRSWFVRSQYVDLFQNVLGNTSKYHVINGSGGIGKSSLLLYILARLRLLGKCVLLHFHTKKEASKVVIFFPADGGEPQEIDSSEPNFYRQFVEWHRAVGKDESYFLVDGIVSFAERNVDGVKYIVAKSPTCSISFIKRSAFKRDLWMTPWDNAELVSYGALVGVADIEKTVAANMFYVGGICRYALSGPDIAMTAVSAAVSEVGAEALLKLVDDGIQSKEDQPKVVDRLLHHIPPSSGEGLEGRSYSFASAYVASKVAQILCLERKIATSLLLQTFKGVSAASGFRGAIFEAYAARKIAEGGSFSVKEIGGSAETSIEIEKTTVYQKDTKTLNKTNYPPKEIKDKLVWPNPDYNLPAIDMLMFRSKVDSCEGHQVTVSSTHSWSITGVRAALKYFDSVCRELARNVPATYDFYFVVPADIYAKFTSTILPFTDKNGAKVDDNNLGKRVRQWVMKVD